MGFAVGTGSVEFIRRAHARPRLAALTDGRWMYRDGAPVARARLRRKTGLYDVHDVGRLLRAAVERAGSQTALAKRHGVHRAYLNMILNGKRPVSDSIAGAVGLRKVYIAR